MRVLALDLGTKCGWALFDNGARVASGVWTLQSDRQRRFEGAGMKWLRLRTNLDNLLEQGRRPQKVALEEVRRHMGVDAAHAYGGALAVVSAWCEANGVPYEGVPVATIKKHATGKGNATKDAMVDAALAKWRLGIDIDDNEADALWLGDFAASEHVTSKPGGGA